MENKMGYKPKDFASDQDVRWCPGCGDYSILAQVERVMPELGLPKENIAWVSGIGCSSRFPYYMNTYGFHSIHGRPLPVATGLKITRPDLSVWVATGDGDCLSIGGNHFIHTCRKNLDIKLLLFNNRIYGLTKGQYSPTTEKGKVTKSSPYGSIDNPFNPLSLALGADATFVARTYASDPKHLREILQKAAEHKGTAFIEIYQNCVIFNNGAFDHLTGKETKDDSSLYLEDGKPMIFGAKRNKGIMLEDYSPVVVDIDDGVHSINDVLLHNETDKSPIRAFILAHLSDNPGFPVPVGVIRRIAKSTYDQDLRDQVETVTAKKGKGSLQNLLAGPNSWKVE